MGSMYQAWALFPHNSPRWKTLRGYGFGGHLSMCPCGPWFWEGCRRPIRETGRTLRLFTTTVHLCAHTAAQTVTQATAYWACRYKMRYVYGQNGNQLILVATLLQVNPWPPNLTQHHLFTSRMLEVWWPRCPWMEKPLLKYLPLEWPNPRQKWEQSTECKACLEVSPWREHVIFPKPLLGKASRGSVSQHNLH